MALPDLDGESLACFVFGPGTGELVLVRAPPNDWLVVDACGRTGATRRDVSVGQAVLRHYGAAPSIVVLTHPHADHASGMGLLIDEHTRDSAPTWPILGMVEPPFTGGVATDDPVGAYATGTAEEALAVIQSAWERRPSSKWALVAGAQQPLGDAVVTALSPKPSHIARVSERWRTGQSVEANGLSAALRVAWKGAQFVLGADLDYAGWVRAAAPTRRSRVAIHQHTALKVPHHGSVKDLSVHLLRTASPPSPRTWTVAPFARERLPRFDAAGGMQQMLRYEAEVHLTALPRATGDQGGPRGTRVRCAQLEALPEGFVPDPPRPGFPDCFVVTMVDAAGGTLPCKQLSCNVPVEIEAP